MVPLNTEPECWNCRHFLRGEDQKICTLHHVILPTDKGPHLICSHWAHAADWKHAVMWWHRKYLTDDGVLYRYQLYSPEPPRPLAAFKKLEASS